MRKPRIYTEHSLSTGAVVELEKGAGHHLMQVLRLKQGMEITLFNGDGHNYFSRLVKVEKRLVVAEVTEQGAAEPDYPLKIDLGIGISKGERMDFAIQKAVELGVDSITPLITERCVVRLTSVRMEKRLIHWRNILVAACEQSGRCRLPQLMATDPMEEWLKECHSGIGILLDHRSNKSMNDLAPPTADERVYLLVGPEGGLTAGEREIAKEVGFQGVRLGPRVLRTETAPLAAIAAMQVLWGDFRSE
ncbi:MAG: 16S rRNA (uracil(1498)-N(3))-methyltransferase [Sedimenticola sp.]